MCRFLAGNELAAAIEDVLAGSDVRCAVARWGPGVLTAFPAGMNPSGARIVCEVMRGGTSLEALFNFAAPKYRNLRSVPNLQAKVYLSDQGAVICSTDTYSNKIGFNEAPESIEVGIFLEASEEAFTQAVTWFEALWKSSKKVDQSLLDFNGRRIRSDHISGPRTVQTGSLLNQIRTDPYRFSEISIVLAHTRASSKEIDRARLAIVKAHPRDEDAIMSMPDDGIFVGWAGKDLARWRRSFIELWMENDRLYCYGRRASFFHDSSGTVLSRRYWPAVRKVVDGDLPDPAEIAEADRETVKRLLNKYGNKMFTARELAIAIGTLS